MRTYHAYIMASRTKVLYTGVTNDLWRRVAEHKSLKAPGFTLKYRVTRLVYYEAFVDINDAIKREKQVKGWKRQKKVALIEADNADWDDLDTSRIMSSCKTK